MNIFTNDNYTAIPHGCMVSALDASKELKANIMFGRLTTRCKTTGETCSIDNHYWVQKNGRVYDYQKNLIEGSGLTIIDYKATGELKYKQLYKKHRVFVKDAEKIRKDYQPIWDEVVYLNENPGDQKAWDKINRMLSDNDINAANVEFGFLEDMASKGEIVKHADGTYSAA